MDMVVLVMVLVRLWRKREHKLLGLMDMVVYYLHGYTSSH